MGSSCRPLPLRPVLPDVWGWLAATALEAVLLVEAIVCAGPTAAGTVFKNSGGQTRSVLQFPAVEHLSMKP